MRRFLRNASGWRSWRLPCSSPVVGSSRDRERAVAFPGASNARLTGIHKIRRVIIISQENRPFDRSFGAGPRADGISMRKANSTAGDLATKGCARFDVDRVDFNGGGLTMR